MVSFENFVKSMPPSLSELKLYLVFASLSKSLMTRPHLLYMKHISTVFIADNSECMYSIIFHTAHGAEKSTDHKNYFKNT